jgi:hypothetical protein
VGQLVAVTQRPGSSPGIVRFELNRALTGMGHEHFLSPADATGPRPAAELARRLFATGKAAGIHVYSNIVTVDLAEGASPEGLDDVLRHLYQYWKPGMEPPTFEDVAEESEAAPADAGGEAAGGDAALSEAAKRVPASLLERSRAARERWKAKSA